MLTRIYWVHEFKNATKVGIMARPRGNEWLEDEIVSCKKQQVHIIVSLLQKEEISELGLGLEEAHCKKHGIKFYSFPIKDREVPDKSAKAENFVLAMFNEVMCGLNIVVHCRMGIGRSSIIAGAIILHAGKKRDDIISEIIKLRGLTVPDTEEQLKWLKLQERNLGR